MTVHNDSAKPNGSLGASIRRARSKAQLTQAAVAGQLDQTRLLSKVLGSRIAVGTKPEIEAFENSSRPANDNLRDGWGARLGQRRRGSGLSQKELADRIGVTQPALSRWEAGKAKPSPSQLAGLEEVLGGLSSGDQENDEPPETSDQMALVGSWLSRTRLARRLSVPELARRAGVSTTSVYLMESGRIKNPRRETRRKLERALNERFPKDAASELAKESSVEGLGELEDFDPNDESEWPLAAGVYVLYDISERPIYVGQGESVRRRLADHQQKFWFKQPLIQTGSFLRVPDAKLRRQVETLLIKFLRKNAILNKQNVER